MSLFVFFRKLRRVPSIPKQTLVFVNRHEMEDFCLLRLNNVKIISEVEQTSNYSIHHAEVAETPCFVKAMRQTGVTGGDAAKDTTELRSRLHRECVLLNRLRHQSIVPFMGIHYDSDPANLALVTGSTYMDLETCLRTYPTMPLSVRISVLLDVLRGVLYLHIQDPSIILCNLTPKSIHVTSDMKGTLTDLNEAIAVGGKVPKTLPAYCQAPESKGHPPRLQRRTDIFHLGVLALRLFSTGREESGSVAQPSESELLQREGSLLVLISSFLHESPELRPRANNACKRLKEIAAKHPKEFSDVLQLYSEQCKMVQCMALIGSAEADSAELLLRCQTLEQEKSQLATAVTALREEMAALQGQLSQSESTVSHTTARDLTLYCAIVYFISLLLPPLISSGTNGTQKALPPKVFHTYNWEQSRTKKGCIKGNDIQ